MGEIVDLIKSLRENEVLEANLNCQLQEQVHALAFVSGSHNHPMFCELSMFITLFRSITMLRGHDIIM